MRLFTIDERRSRRHQALKFCLTALSIGLAGQAMAQQLTLPADAPTTYTYNRKVEAKPAASCTSEDNRCKSFCNNNSGQINSCYADCNGRIEYCRKSGIYMWINSPSAQVGKKD